jgi:glycosyltransferase involved in cell wall biosynthesis
MSSKCPDYSIVIPAFNEERFLPATLASLKAAMKGLNHEGEIVVCNNNSTDRTAAIARAAGARVVFEPINQISRARNSGARAARGRWLVWVDADTHLPADLLRAAIDRLAAGRTVGGGSVVEMDGPQRCCISGLVRLWTRIAIRWGLAAGAFVFALREAFDAVGGFSEKVYASEEIWFSRAISRWGRERGLTFEVLVEHPAVTSQRKTEWYSTPAIFGVLLLITVFPFLILSRRFCFMWYRRPASARST